MDLATAIRAGTTAEVDFSGTVTTAARFFMGTHTRAEHETFGVRTSCGNVQVIDNVDLAPCVPVRPGDRVDVRGEYVHDAGKGPIVHWTHHDPAHLHEDGFIRLRGRVYA